MAKLGQFDYPDYKFSRALEVVGKICDPSYRGELLQMSVKGGGFHMLLASIRDFGLIEGSDQLRVTEIGKKAISGTLEEAERAKAEAFLNVGLFKELYQRSGTTVPEDEKLFVLLREITKEDPLKVKGQLKDVASTYSDGIRYLGVLNKPETDGTMFSTSGIPVVTPTEPARFIEIKAGPYFQRLPHTRKGIEIAVNFLKSLDEEKEPE